MKMVYEWENWKSFAWVLKNRANATFMKQPVLPPFLFLFYLDFKQFSSACVDKLYTTAVWGATLVFYIF